MIHHVLFQQFQDEKRFVSNIAPTTTRFYKSAFNAFALSDLPTKETLNAAIVRMRSNGMSVGAVNAYIRGLNPFLSWLFENGHLAENLMLKKLKCPEPQMKTFSDAEIRSLLNFKPKTKSEKRLLVILNLLIDTGLRIDEALSLTRSAIDFENLLIDVRGKGGKIRKIPISPQCRRTLYRHISAHNFDLVFCNWYGTKLLYSDVRRTFVSVLEQLGMSMPPRSAFHSFRRYWTTFAAKRGVSAFLIQKNLGHSSLAMTQKYCRLETADLSAAHTSALQAGGIR
jgi:integrase/recombinase XerD